MSINPYVDYDPYNEYIYGRDYGGKWFYKQDSPGTAWFDRVSNELGWTVSFSLDILEIENSLLLNYIDTEDGLGILVCDDKYSETITFYSQEIFFKNANARVTYDATALTTYVLTGKGNLLKLFASSDGLNYSLLISVPFNTPSSSSGNATKPKIVESSTGLKKTLWLDDGSFGGELYVSEFQDDTESWTMPVQVLGLSNILYYDAKYDLLDNLNIVAIEGKSGSNTLLHIVQNENGFGDADKLLVQSENIKNVEMSIDSYGNIYAVWEDYRYGNPEIYCKIKDNKTLQWGDDIQVTSTSLGAYRPKTDTLGNKLYISWTSIEGDNYSKVYLTIYKEDGTWVTVEVSEIDPYSPYESGIADYSDVLSSISGIIYVVWADFSSSWNFKIAVKQFGQYGDELSSTTYLTSGDYDCLYPVISRRKETGDVYIVWSGYNTAQSVPYLIELAYYNVVNKSWSHSSIDYMAINFSDLRIAEKPVISKQFSSFLHIAYENSYQSSSQTFLDRNLLFKNIFDVIYDLTSFPAIFDVDTDDQNDLHISQYDNRKEIRFGDFSNTLSVNCNFVDFKYYLNGAVDPEDVLNISKDTYDFGSNFVCYDSVVNSFGGAWIASNIGLVSIFDGYVKKISGITDPVIAIVFDNNNNLFCTTGDKVYYSVDHANFTEIVFNESLEQISCLNFDKDNKLFIGTDANGFYIYNVIVPPLSGSASVSISNIFSYNTDNSILKSNKINKIAIDANNIAWIATSNGLYRLYKQKLIAFYVSNGLPSNYINDIAIASVGVRYIATLNGISHMVGSSFETISAADSDIWSQNIKSIAYKESNTILASTLSKLNQIALNDDGSVKSTVVYDLQNYSKTMGFYDDYNTYYILTDNIIPEKSVVEVYLNGTPITFGFNVFRGELDDSSAEDNVIIKRYPAIKFKTSLLESDVVSIRIRNDIKEYAELGYNDIESLYFGDMDVRIISFDYPYMIVAGDINQILKAQSVPKVAFDSIILDMDPPVGRLELESIIDANTVKLRIRQLKTGELCGEGGNFPLIPFDSDSGISKMVVSNYSNFTTDGITEQSPIDFSESVIHNLNISNSLSEKQVTFSGVKGCVIYSCSNGLYAGTRSGAVLYKYNINKMSWDVLRTFGTSPSLSIDFIKKINGELIVGVGDTGAAAIIYRSYYETGGIEQGFVPIATTSGTNVFAAHELNYVLYMGSSPDGTIYKYSGGSVDIAYVSVGEYIYDIAGSDETLYVATGNNGRIYSINLKNAGYTIIHSDSDANIKSINVVNDGTSNYIYAGTGSQSKIIKSLINKISFVLSFRTLPGTVSKIKSFEYGIDPYNSRAFIFASVDKNIYYFDFEKKGWGWLFTNLEDILDFTYDSSSGFIYIISENYIYKLQTNDEYKNIYMKLIDSAGNETSLILSSGQLNCNLYTQVGISDLQNYDNFNSLIEIDPYGNTIDKMSSSSPFYSAFKIDVERGEYYSEIFSGTNELVKWDRFSWAATQPANTSVFMYIRTSDSKNDILNEGFKGPFGIGESSGIDIGYLTGKFIQFKAVLISHSRGVSPSLSSAVIKMITGDTVHFFTTNFTLPGKIKRGILTSHTIKPVYSDIIFGINTADSTDFSDYQIIDENQLFEIDSPNNNFRIGVKFISPSGSVLAPSYYDEYGPYGTFLFVNTIFFNYANMSTGLDFQQVKFIIEFYDDHALNNLVYTMDSELLYQSFTVDGLSMTEPYAKVDPLSEISVLCSPPSVSGIICDTYYFVKIIIAVRAGDSEEIIGNSYIKGAGSTYVNDIDFEYVNHSSLSKIYQFRIRFYTDVERTALSFTKYSGNDYREWFLNNGPFPISGYVFAPEESASIVFVPDFNITDYETGRTYYLSIDAFDGSEFINTSNDYTFIIQSSSDIVYCGEYKGVPIVKNFGMMFEMDDGSNTNLYIDMVGLSGETFFLESPSGVKYKIDIDENLLDLVTIFGNWENEANKIVLISESGYEFRMFVTDDGTVYSTMQSVSQVGSKGNIIIQSNAGYKYSITVNDSGDFLVNSLNY